MGYEEEPQGREEKPEGEVKDEYSFMQETIKEETGSRKKTKNLILKYAGLGLVFGLTASLGFSALKPWAEKKFQNNPEKVTIPAEEEEEDAVQEDEEQEETTPALTIDSYREMNQALGSVGNEANKSVVEITGITESQTWQQEAYDTKNSVAGVCVGDNGREMLIFAKSSVVKDSESLTAEFSDGKVYHAELKLKDENVGFAIFSVAKADIQESTINQIKAVEFGSSNSMGKGDLVIALGKPFGYSWAMGFGVIASPKNVIKKADGEYRLLCTDITGTDNGTGILVNIKGELVGVIDQEISEEDSMNLVTAYGITDLKELIELMINGRAVPYIGIRGATVTESISQEQGIPRGIYVQEVKADSPAMAAGIQSGDVITSVDKEEVSTLSAYHTILMKQSKGKEIKVKGQRQGAGGYVDINFTVTVGSRE